MVVKQPQKEAAPPASLSVLDDGSTTYAALLHAMITVLDICPALELVNYMDGGLDCGLDWRELDFVVMIVCLAVGLLDYCCL